MPNKYYTSTNDNDAKTADVYIFGDIVSAPKAKNSEPAESLAREIAGISPDVADIRVHINSYGGEVAEGLAIYNALKKHPAHIITYCEGFACSSAANIFMAGDERIMYDASMLMVHNAWTNVTGDAATLRKEAADLEKINEAVLCVYLNAGLNIDEAALREILAAESWLTAADALRDGFSTAVMSVGRANRASSSARKAAFSLLLSAVSAKQQNAGAGITPPECETDEQPAIETEEQPENGAEEQPANVPENSILKFFNALCGKKEDKHHA